MLDPDYGGTDNNGVAERRKLIIRAAIAAGLVAALLAALLIFEQQKEPTTPPALSVSQPDIGVSVSSAASAIPEDVQKAIAEAPDTTQTALASVSTPAVEAATSTPPAPVVPEGTMDPSVKPILNAPPSPVTGARTPPARAGKEAHADRLVVESGRAAPPPAATATPAPPPQPAPAIPVQTPVPGAATAAQGQMVTVTPTPALPTGSFAVQLGVFSNVTNAEELRTKLKQAGIPAQLETRVQVGPFTSKEEALRAQDKLRTLGLGKGMLVVAGKKP